jgi:serine protease inhibitor
LGAVSCIVGQVIDKEETLMRLATLLIAAVGVALGQPQPPPDRVEPMPPEIWADESAVLPLADHAVQVPAETRLVKGTNDFGFAMLRELALSSPDKNVFVSPTSVALALGMAYTGAAGPTRDAMAAALRLQGMTPGEADTSFSELLAGLASSDPKVRVDIANSLWARKGVKFSDEYLQAVRDLFAAEAKELDFSSAAAPATINAWVKAKTGGKIPSIVETIDPDDVLFLVNAVYFKGKWTNAFDKKLTKEGDFHLGADDEKRVMMMSRQAEFDYSEDPQLQAVRLPYGDGQLAMYVFLPRQPGVEGSASMPDHGVGLEEFLGRLNPEDWSMWLDRFEPRQGRLVLPRFKLEYTQKLNEVLKSMGMAEAFEPGMADFSAMFAEPGSRSAYISEVRHKTFVEVNEEGTEAAAATSVGVTLTAMPTEEPFLMVADRPFCCVIADQKTGAVLFAGAIRDPS